MSAFRKKFRWGIVLRIIMILVVAITAFIMAMLTPYWLISIWLGVLVLVLCAELIRYHERSMKALREFLQFLKQGEFASLSTVDATNKEYQEAYEIILNQFRQLRIEREKNYHYLKRVIEHVDTALICLDNEKSIQLINHAAMKLLQIPEIKDIEALVKVDEELATLVSNIQSGEKEMIRFIRHGRIMKLSIRATEFTLEEQLFKIVSLQDIKSELEEQELESWHKLVRVLTHEIMNSAIPISNMVSVAKKLLHGEGDAPRKIEGLTNDDVTDLLESLSTAENRSQGLSKFVQATQNLTRIPKPQFENLPVEILFSRLEKIFKPDMDKASVICKNEITPSSLVVKADKDLVEQVLINLVKNALDALKGTEKPVIELNAYKTREGGIVVEVCDNGQGISKEQMDQVFIPYYSTKKDGSGIGLSLSRQIMKLHKGRIDIQSEEGEGTCVSMEF